MVISNSGCLGSLQVNTASYSEIMKGTETYAPGGSISGGSDSFTWMQSANDSGSIAEAGGYDTLGASVDYDISIFDWVSDTLSDVGTDILGASDSILGGSDTYSISEFRNLASSVTDLGTSATPYYILGYGWDLFGMSDSGSSTLTTDGHVYATDTFAYVEDSGETDSVGQSVSGSVLGGSAYDYYLDTDSGTITVSDAVTTSFDSFTLLDTHSVSGQVVYATTNTTMSENWSDAGDDVNTLNANGTSGGDSYTFVDTDTSDDDYVLKKAVYGSYNISFTEVQGNTQTISGFTRNSPSGNSYSFVTSDYESSYENETGNQTYFGFTVPISYSTSSSTTLVESVTGPPPTVTTLTSTGGTTTSGSTGGIGLTETMSAGHGDTYGGLVAGLLGSFPDGVYGPGGAVHGGTTPPAYDMSQGLVSAIGGQDVHALEFAGAEILPVNASSAGVILEEPNESTPNSPDVRQLEIVDHGGWATGAAVLGWGGRAVARMAGSKPWRTPAPTAASRASNDMTP